MIKFVHDHFFKYAMCNKDIAQEFIKTHVTSEYLKKMNLTTLMICNNEHVSDKLKKSQTDVLYKLEISEYPYYAYVLIEHQSKFDRFEAKRYFQYNGDVMRQHLLQNPSSDMCQVYTIFFNNHAGLSAERKAYYRKHYPLLSVVDVVNISDCDLVGDMSIFKMIFKHVKLGNVAMLKEQMSKVIDAVRRKKLPEQFIYASAKYIISNVETKDRDIFVRYLNGFMQFTGDYMRTVATYLKAEGRKEGRKEGREEGRQEGRQEGKRAAIKSIVSNMLSQGMQLEEISKMIGVADQELASMA